MEVELVVCRTCGAASLNNPISVEVLTVAVPIIKIENLETLTISQSVRVVGSDVATRSFTKSVNNVDFTREELIGVIVKVSQLEPSVASIVPLVGLLEVDVHVVVLTSVLGCVTPADVFNFITDWAV